MLHTRRTHQWRSERQLSLVPTFGLVHEVAIVYYDGNEAPIVNRVPQEFAESSYQKLLHWADGLGASVIGGELRPDHVVNFQ